MAQIVMQFECGDKYTWSATETIPIISESPEQALCDFEKAYTDAKNTTIHWGGRYTEFTFAGKEFATDPFEEDGVFYPPDFMTVDEWFARCSEQ